MNLAKQHVYLIFDIQNRFIQRVGKVQILIHKETELEKENSSLHRIIKKLCQKK